MNPDDHRRPPTNAPSTAMDTFRAFLQNVAKTGQQLSMLNLVMLNCMHNELGRVVGALNLRKRLGNSNQVMLVGNVQFQRLLQLERILRTLDNKTDDVADELDDLPKKMEPTETIDALGRMLQQLQSLKDETDGTMKDVFESSTGDETMSSAQVQANEKKRDEIVKFGKDLLEENDDLREKITKMIHRQHKKSIIMTHRQTSKSSN